MNDKDIGQLAAAGVYEGHKINGDVEETHISWVVLASHYVFKIKKPVKLSFLDFSTLELRKYYCEKEVELNTRFTDIYLSVQPVTGSDEGWIVGAGEGEVVDYCVVMRRMASEMRMDKILRSGTIEPEVITALALKVGHFHRNALKISTSFNIDLAKNTFNDILLVRQFVSSQLGDHYLDIITQSLAWSNEFLAAHALRFQQRIGEGFQRDVHGDLHAGNIFLYPDPVIFDCIEFNDQFRHIDVLYEVAYLCMDLESSGHSRYAEVFLAAYLKQFPAICTSEDLLLFNYFKALRANVRAKINVIGASEENDPEEIRRYSNEAMRYLKILKHYATS